MSSGHVNCKPAPPRGVRSQGSAVADAVHALMLMGSVSETPSEQHKLLAPETPRPHKAPRVSSPSRVRVQPSAPPPHRVGVYHLSSRRASQKPSPLQYQPEGAAEEATREALRLAVLEHNRQLVATPDWQQSVFQDPWSSERVRAGHCRWQARLREALLGASIGTRKMVAPATVLDPLGSMTCLSALLPS